jgi:hypothetical protein
MSVDIEPFQLTFDVAKIKVDVLTLVLNERAVIRVMMMNADGAMIKSDTFELIKPDYSLWLSDDNLIDYVCDKYGFTKVVEIV